jgi:hypothetical protein
VRWDQHRGLISGTLLHAVGRHPAACPALLPTFCVLCKINVQSLVSMEALSALLPGTGPALACVFSSSSSSR